MDTTASLSSSISATSHLDELEKLSAYLSELESELTLFWNLSPALKCIAKDGRFTKINPSWTDVLGYQQSELIGRPYADFIHPDDLNKTAAIEHILENGSTVRRFVNRYRHKDGRWICLDWVARSEPHSGVTYATATDCTDRERSKTEIHELAQHDRIKAAALDRCAFSILITDATKDDNPIIYVNRLFTKMTGYTAQEVLGKNPRFLHHAAMPGASDVIRHAVKNHIPYAGVLLNKRKDGTLFYNQLIVTPVIDSNGHTTNFVGISQDVTPVLDGQLLDVEHP